MHFFVYLSYVSERVLARADVCMIAEWMMFVDPSSLDSSIHLDTKIKQIYEQSNGPWLLDMLYVSKCGCVLMLNEWCLVFHLGLMMDMCVFVCLLNECCLLFHLALMMDLCVFSYMHAFAHWHHCWMEETGYLAGNPPYYRQTRRGCSFT